MKHDAGKWLKVTHAEFNHAAGNSIFKHWLPSGNTWTLTLEDGSKRVYPVRYKPPTEEQPLKRGWMRRRSSEDALPPPKKVKKQ